MNDNFDQASEIDVTQPKLCYTASGMLLHRKKVLLVKHKKLQVWLNPGGHINQDELPHQAAEREFFEETGIKVKAIDATQFLNQTELVQKFTDQIKTNFPPSANQNFFLPNPLDTHLHWVNYKGYQARQASKNPERRFADAVWHRGCEKHLNFLYLLEPVGSVTFTQNIAETDGIEWFSQSEVAKLETADGVLNEVGLGFLCSMLQ